ncbi:MAG: hypothetical protein K8R21_10450 [Leptospira sp.]|nr:hypothetical protein [Leptospira sp.]
MTNKLSISEEKERALGIVSLIDEVLRTGIQLRQFEKIFHSDSGMSETELSIFFDLFSLGQQTVPSMARSHHQTRQRIQQVTDILLRKKLIEKSLNPAHANSPFFSLSVTGKRLALAMTNKEKKFFLKFPIEISPGSLERSKKLLKDLRLTLHSFLLNAQRKH